MKVLWAVKIGEPDYMEEVITEDQSKIESAKKQAEQNGYNRFRIAIYSDIPEKPDFVRSLNI